MRAKIILCVPVLFGALMGVLFVLIGLVAFATRDVVESVISVVGGVPVSAVPGAVYAVSLSDAMLAARAEETKG